MERRGATRPSAFYTVGGGFTVAAKSKSGGVNFHQLPSEWFSWDNISCLDEYSGGVYGVIYGVRCDETGRIYVGQTTLVLSARIKAHLSSAKNFRDIGSNRYCVALYRAIRSYGLRGLSFAIFRVSSSSEELDELERNCISEYNALVPIGMNVSAGGRFSPVMCVETGDIYRTATDAAIKNGAKSAAGSSNIIKSCRGVANKAYGYHWKYVERVESFVNRNPRKQGRYPVRVKCVESGTLYSSAMDAARSCGKNYASAANRIITSVGTGKKVFGRTWEKCPDGDGYFRVKNLSTGEVFDNAVYAAKSCGKDYRSAASRILQSARDNTERYGFRWGLLYGDE